MRSDVVIIIFGSVISNSVSLENACDYICSRMESCISPKTLECKPNKLEPERICRRLFRSSDGGSFASFVYHDGDSLKGERPVTCLEAQKWANMNRSRNGGKDRPIVRKKSSTVTFVPISLGNACENVCSRMSTCLSPKALECKSDGTCRRLFFVPGVSGLRGFRYHEGDADLWEVPLRCSDAFSWSNANQLRSLDSLRPILRPQRQIVQTSATLHPMSCQYVCNRMAGCTGNIVECSNVDVCSNLFINTKIKGFRGFTFHQGRKSKKDDIPLTCTAASVWKKFNESRHGRDKRLEVVLPAPRTQQFTHKA